MIEGLVSVIMPIFNGEKFLDRSIQSVLTQTYKFWELILIDDKSDDNSVFLIKKYISDDRIKLVQNSRNQGISYTRNKGIKHSNGEYIALLDQDDEWLPEKLEMQVPILKKSGNEYALIYSKAKILRNGEMIYGSRDISPKDSILENQKKLFFSNFISSLTVVMRKNCILEIGLFDENIKWGGDDYELWLRISEKYKFTYVDKFLAIRHDHGSNFSFSSKKKMMTESILLTNKYAERNPLLKPFLREKKAITFYRYGIENIKTGSFFEGIRYIMISFFISSTILTELKNSCKNFIYNNQFN